MNYDPFRHIYDPELHQARMDMLQAEQDLRTLEKEYKKRKLELEAKVGSLRIEYLGIYREKLIHDQVNGLTGVLACSIFSEIFVNPDYIDNRPDE